MKFKIGDNVSVIDDSRKGIIKSLTDYKAIIKDEDGFELEIQLNKLAQLSSVSDYESSFNDIPNVEILEEKIVVSKKNISRQEKVIDLHMSELSGYQNGMSNHEIVVYQLEAVHKAMRDTDKRYYSKIVFIHGVGTGKLKNELKILLKHKSIYFQDASFTKYGQGAIEILI